MAKNNLVLKIHQTAHEIATLLMTKKFTLSETLTLMQYLEYHFSKDEKYNKITKQLQVKESSTLKELKETQYIG